MADVPDILSYKNCLQELMQKSNLGIPEYQTVAQGSHTILGFKSSVMVDGVQYTSEKTFPSKKTAENHIAKVAFESASETFKADALSIIYKDPIFCKSIVNEYATKMDIPIPVYHTVQAEGAMLPVFTSSLVFNEVPYTGEACRTKKDSEQLAARAVILSILGKSDSGNTMSVIIKSKSKKHYDLLHKGKEAPPRDYVAAEVVNPETNNAVIPPPLSPQTQVEELVAVTSTDDNSRGVLLPHTVDHHDPVISIVRTESNLAIQPQIEGEGEESETTRIGGGGGGGAPATGKRSKNKNKKKNKKMRIAAEVASTDHVEPVCEVPIAAAASGASSGVVHFDPVPSCSVAP